MLFKRQSCDVTNDCIILDGTTTNGTFYISGYDPNAEVPYWHRNMELATICIANSLTLIVIVARIWYRRIYLKRFQSDDICMIFAGAFTIAYTISQIGTVYWGSGFHTRNIPDEWLEWHWHYTPGWAGYYVVTTCIKLSVCLCLLGILPYHLQKLRVSVYAISILIVCLGIVLTFGWLFQCTPVLSNFLWEVESDSCLNYDILRWLWVAVNIPVDIAMVTIPLRILQKVQLQVHEKRILNLVFSANLLGTVAAIVGIWGVYANRTSEQVDMFYAETIFIMLNDIEIFMYTLGASFPVLSRYLVAASSPSSSNNTASNFSSWARRIPDLFSTNRRHTLKTHTLSTTDLRASSLVNDQKDSESNKGSTLHEKPAFEMADLSQMRHPPNFRMQSDSDEELGVYGSFKDMTNTRNDK